MDWFNFWLNGFNIAAQGCLQLSFACHFTEKKRKLWYFPLYLVLLYVSNIPVTSIYSHGLTIGIPLLSLYAINRLFLNNSRPVSCVTSILAVYVAQLSFGVVNSLELLFFPYALGYTLLLQLLVILGLLLALALCLCCYYVISKQFLLQSSLREPYIWMLLPPALFFFAVELYIFQTAYDPAGILLSSAETGKQLALLALQILSLSTLFCGLYAYKRTCDGLKAQAALASLAQEAHAQKTYVAEAQMRYEQTRAFRHDIKNHLSVLNGLLKADHLDQAKSYLQKLETVTEDLSFPFHTNNPVVDILLGDKLALAKAFGVKSHILLTLPKPCQVDDFDLCVIFANALDNAIHASMQAGGANEIHITGERQGDFYMLEFENTCSVKPWHRMGTGLSNIRAAAEKYGGTMTIETSFCTFRLNVLLNISRQPENRSEQNP